MQACRCPSAMNFAASYLLLTHLFSHMSDFACHHACCLSAFCELDIHLACNSADRAASVRASSCTATLTTERPRPTGCAAGPSPAMCTILGMITIRGGQQDLLGRLLQENVAHCICSFAASDTHVSCAPTQLSDHRGVMHRHSTVVRALSLRSVFSAGVSRGRSASGVRHGGHGRKQDPHGLVQVQGANCEESASS